jgi:hypothetical protein
VVTLSASAQRRLRQPAHHVAIAAHQGVYARS